MIWKYVSCRLLLYVDGSVLLVLERNLKINILTKDLQSCTEWLVDKLSLHLKKTEPILCGSKKREKLKNFQDFEVKCKGVSITMVSVVNYLGLSTGSHMSSESVWKSVISKCHNRLRFLYRQAG